MTDTPIQVSIVIPAYGRPDLLRVAIRSALAQNFDPDRFEVIVIDSSPNDDNVAMAEQLRPEARCRYQILRKKPEGPGYSRNFGTRAAAGAFLAFLDSDCEASAGWLAAGFAAFEDGVGLVQGKTINQQGVPYSVFNRTVEFLKEDHIYATTNIFYRRAAFEAAGAFMGEMLGQPDGRLIPAEDVDLAWKVKRAGWQTRFAAGAVVEHAVVRMPVWRWFCEIRLGTLAWVVKNYPETRRYYFARYFFDQTQALLVLALAGVALAFVTLWSLLLALPYVASRGLAPSKTLKGPLRLLRVPLYLPRDLFTLGSLVAGSIRYGALIL